MAYPELGRNATSSTSGPEQAGVWVYAVAAAPPGPLPSVTGVNGAHVRAVAGGGPGGAELAAFVSTVDLAEFGEEALRRNLEDLDWLAVMARAHHAVIGALAERGPVAPMRLATVFHGDDRVAAMLERQAAELSAALDRVRASREWGVKVHEAPAGAAVGSHDAPDAAGGSPEREAAGPSGPGAAYLSRRRRQLSARQEARRDAQASAAAIHQQLSRIAKASRQHPPQAPQLSGAATPMIVNAAYLVADDRAEEFMAAARALAGRFQSVRVEVTGPWPPYSFAAALPEGRR